MGQDATSVLNDAHFLPATFNLIDVVFPLCAGRRRSRARVTDVNLNYLRLSTIEESLARIALIKVPADTILMSFLIGRQTTQVWGGMTVGAGELIAIGPGSELFVRTEGACRWCILCSPVALFARFCEAITGAPAPSLAAVSLRRPLHSRISRLRHFHTAATRMAHSNWQLLAESEAVRGLEQELTHSMVECVVEDRATKPTASCRRQQELVSRLHRYLLSCKDNTPDLFECSAVLGVSLRALHVACERQFGMGTDDYLLLWRSQSGPAA